MKNIFQNSMELCEMEQIENQQPSSISYTLSASSESFASSQTIYNSYNNYYNDEMSMEAVTLSTVAAQKPKNIEAFSKTHKITSGTRDLSILTTAAVDIAKDLNASAIITFSEEPLKIPSTIPFFVFTPRKSTMINELTRYIEENNNNIYNKVETRARSASNDIGDAAVIAYVNNLLDSGGLVVGIIRMNDSDAIVVYDLSTNRTMKKLKECTERVDASVLRSVLNVAFEIATKGHEGKSYGTAFIIGDSNEVLRRSHPLLMNPFEGQTNSFNIVNPECWETVKNYAQIDGTYVITGKGIIRAAGVYLDIDAKDMSLQKGLGGRHTSAAAITRDTETIAVTVSSSGGTIRIFKDGLELLKIEPDIMLVQ